jgi:hypothetical protein
MARTPEGKVKDACTVLIKKYGAYYFYPVMGGFGRAGVPDIIVCHRGRFLAIECKAGSNKPTPLQEKEMAAIRAAQGETMVIRETNQDILENWLKEISNE